MEPSRELAFLERFSLEGVAKGWTAGHYVEYRMMTADDALELKGANDDMSEDESVQTMKEQIKRRVVGGRVLTVSGETVDLIPEDIDRFPVSVLSRMFAVMNGVVDPKDEAPTSDSQSSTTTA